MHSDDSNSNPKVSNNNEKFPSLPAIPATPPNVDPERIRNILIFKCDCGLEHNFLTLKISSFLHGVILLRGKQNAYIGINCPSCFKTIIRQGSVNEIKDIKEEYLSVNIHLLRYHPSLTSLHPKSFPAIDGIKIQKSFNFAKPNDEYFDMNLLTSYDFSDSPVEYYSTYFFDQQPPIAGHATIWWLTEKQILEIVEMENENKKRILPRYDFTNRIIEFIDNFCLIDDLVGYYCRDLDENTVFLQEDGDIVITDDEYNELRSGVPINDILKKRPGAQTKQIFQTIYSNLIESNKIDVTSNYLNIICHDDSYLLIPLPLITRTDKSKSQNGIPHSYPLNLDYLWKVRNPFYQKKITIESIDSFPSVSDDTEKQAKEKTDEIISSVKKGYVQQIILDESPKFIKEYLDLTMQPDFSLAAILELRNKYRDKLYDAIKGRGTARHSTICEEKCREEAKRIWDKETSSGKKNTTTIKEMIEYLQKQQIAKNKQGSVYHKDVIRGWIKDLAPNRTPGRRPQSGN